MRPEKPIRGYPCSVDAFIHELAEKNPAEHDLFVGVLYETNRRGWVHSGTSIYRMIRSEREQHGYETDVKLQTINRHRSGQCRCVEAQAS